MIPLNNYSYIFDRRRASHPWEASLVCLQNSSIPGLPALAANWRMDSRVDNVRENQLVGSGYFPTASSLPDFCKAVSNYFTYHQCRQAGAKPEPGYASTENSANLIPIDQRPARNHYLLHIASLNRLLKFVLRAENPNRTDFQIQLSRLTGERPITAVGIPEVEKLANTLNTLGLDGVKKFAFIVSGAIGENEPLWWAAFAHEVRNFSVSEDWTGAVCTLGLGAFETGERLLAWRYSPEIAGRLYRPTVAEARDNGFHFPSPPGLSYGITMPLLDGLSAVRELVHAPLKGAACFSACTGMIGKIENPPVPVVDEAHLPRWFSERRGKHRAYLERHHIAPSTQHWLERHSGLP